LKNAKPGSAEYKKYAEILNEKKKKQEEEKKKKAISHNKNEWIVVGKSKDKGKVATPINKNVSWAQHIKGQHDKKN
jgi:hypothetical protein